MWRSNEERVMNLEQNWYYLDTSADKFEKFFIDYML